MTYLMGLDISTTGAKALIVDERGAVIASHNTPQPISTPQPLWSEQHPSDWWDGIVLSIRAALESANVRADEIGCIGLTGQMHGLVLQDSGGRVLRPAMLWNDQRTGAQCDAITARVGFERLIQLTGNRALTGFTAPKILWVREHEPEVYAQAAHMLLPKDYIRYCLTGDYAMEMSDASGTNLLDVANRRWSDEVAAALEVPLSWLPTLYEGTQITGIVSQAAAEATGLRAGTPVVGGGSDQAAGAVGVGAVEEGIISLVVGTSGVVFAALDHYDYEPEGRLHAFCHAAPNLWHLMGVMLSAAGSLQWYHDALAPETSFDGLTAEADTVPPGSDGLLFLPYLTGERTPHPDPLARGAFVGLTVRHTRAHLTRAVLEGVAFGLKDSFELMQGAGLKVREVRVSGGGAKSALWRQILADVLNAPLLSTATTEGAAYGAAVLAAVGAGVYPDVRSACAAMVNTEGAATLPQHSDLYTPSYEVYKGLYPALKETFTRI